jgi:hypothetical protein
MPAVAINPASNTVKIDSANPVAVRDVDNSAREPFAARFSAPFSIGTIGIGVGPQAAIVPAGRRFVIEHVSVFVELPAGQKVSWVEVTTIAATNGGGTDIRPGGFVPTSFQATSGGFDTFVGSEAMKLYADGGTYQPEILVNVQRDTAGAAGLVVAEVSGYLVATPQ